MGEAWVGHILTVLVPLLFLAAAWGTLNAITKRNKEDIKVIMEGANTKFVFLESSLNSQVNSMRQTLERLEDKLSSNESINRTYQTIFTSCMKTVINYIEAERTKSGNAGNGFAKTVNGHKKELEDFRKEHLKLKVGRI